MKEPRRNGRAGAITRADDFFVTAKTRPIISEREFLLREFFTIDSRHSRTRCFPTIGNNESHELIVSTDDVNSPLEIDL